MDRKESLKTILLGTASLPFLKGSKPAGADTSAENVETAVQPMRSDWAEWPDMEWVGPGFWGNRLQDWQLLNGKVRCSVSAPNRSLHSLTHQLRKTDGHFTTEVTVDFMTDSGEAKDRVGFRLGAKAENTPVRVSFDDYRRNAVFGEGLEAGLRGDGRLFIGAQTGSKTLDVSEPVRLTFTAEPAGGSYRAVLAATAFTGGELLDELTVNDIGPESLVGNLALIAHYLSQEDEEKPSVVFSDWQISGSKVRSDLEQAFGPICFAQYTLDRGILKMTAQLAPVEAIDEHQVALQIRENGSWNTLQQTHIDPLSRTAHFRLEGWSRSQDIPYRIQLTLPLRNQSKQFYYNGTIAADPVSADQLKTVVFSCNAHHGFPNAEVVRHVAKHKPDMAVFLGDQFYESHGGFGIQRSPIKKAALDFLRKWYMFGWSYRDVFRHIPSAFIPDDHDVYHGNIWGQGGKEAPVEKGWGYNSQDEGGYKMPPKWVNMVQRAQTSNLPDPYDPTPVKQDIGVYYTDWAYGGISFAILEDRKFKTAPKNTLPKEANVVNGFIQNRDFDIREHYDIDAQLLGERQLAFLEEWAGDWSHTTQMKAVLSQTNFCTVATLPEGSIIDKIVPRLPIPERGTYVQGDAPTTDMDSNGWPQKGRDRALRKIRKGFALHIAGDQHLASMVQYGIEEHGDAGFGFAGPALNNIWPRRWWPPVGDDHKPLPGRPGYTGQFEDGFGNKMTVHAVANPVQTNRKPGLIYDRATGYGIVIFDKVKRAITIECWPRYVDPQANPEGQYDGWPVTIEQQQNYGRKPTGYLPEVIVEGLNDPVIQLYNETTDQLEYALRIKGNRFTPKIFDAQAIYKIKIGEPDRDQWQEYAGLKVNDDQTIKCKF